MPQIKVNDINIYYELRGPEAADVIVFSNGIFMSTASWGLQVAELQRHFRVLVYDCRGMWRSDHPQGPYSMAQHADDLAGLLKALGIPKAHIAGISYGGEVSMVFAIKYPAMVRSLIVSSSVSQIDPLLWAIGQSWADALLQKDAGMLFDVTLPYNFSEQWLVKNAELLAATKKRYEEMDFESVSELMTAFLRLNLTDELSKITAPTLLLVGEDDILKPRKYSELIASKIPASEFIIIPEAGHAVCLEQPSAFNSAVMGFVLKHCEAVA
ncbi:MAG: alpha/beta fold hydrolase [Anaerolineae bacterium]|nr:alpha/beta fold hydrolase [Anaerolineae bacterium]